MKQKIKPYHKKSKLWAQILGRFPGVAAIFLSGSLATGTADQKSDIDFFIIAHPGQIWTARFWVFCVLKIFRGISTETNHAGQICPNHFITSNSLEIQEQDAYAAHLFSHNQPLYDPTNIFPHFIHKNREWIEMKGEFFDQEVSDFLPNRKPKTPNRIEKIIERGLRSLQLKKIYKNPERTKPHAKIILTETELRFHPKPKNRKKAG